MEQYIVFFPPSEAKGERTERVIYLTERAMEICREGIERFLEGPIMSNSKNNPWTKDAIGCRFKGIRKKLGRAANSYAIRHRYATNGLISGMDSLTLSQLMGHCDVSMLARNYKHLSKNPEYLKTQAKRLRA